MVIQGASLCMVHGLRSALAEAEVEYQDRHTLTVDTAFNSKHQSDRRCLWRVIRCRLKSLMAIWTTTPWTLPANQFIAVNAGLPCARFEKNGTTWTLVLAEGRLEPLSERYGIDEFTILGHTTGAKLAEFNVKRQGERIVPVITGEHVTLEAGTGVPLSACLWLRFNAAKALDIELLTPVRDDGTFSESVLW